MYVSICLLTAITIKQHRRSEAFQRDELIQLRLWLQKELDNVGAWHFEGLEHG